jgi:bifunctional ADP-heptose synthase (sugar kinase/adenylyltransferase)
MFSNATLFGAGESGDEMLYGRNSLLNDIATAMQSVNGGGDIVVNVYGSDNMSVSELASAVEQRLIQAQKRRTQAWA